MFEIAKAGIYTDDVMADVMYIRLAEINGTRVEKRMCRDNLVSVLNRWPCEARCSRAAAYIKASPTLIRVDAGHSKARPKIDKYQAELPRGRIPQANAVREEARTR